MDMVSAFQSKYYKHQLLPVRSLLCHNALFLAVLNKEAMSSQSHPTEEKCGLLLLKEQDSRENCGSLQLVLVCVGLISASKITLN